MSGSYLLGERGGGGGGSRVDAPTTTGRPSRRLPPQGAPRVAGDAERAGRSQRGGCKGVYSGGVSEVYSGMYMYSEVYFGMYARVFTTQRK